MGAPLASGVLSDNPAHRTRDIAQALGSGPEPVAIAAPGIKTADRLGILTSNFFAPLPDLVPELRRLTGRSIAPLFDDSSAAAVAEYHWGGLAGASCGYYLAAGTGLAEAILEDGSPLEDFVRAYTVGLEKPLATESWWSEPDETLVSALRELLDWRLKTLRPDKIVLAQRFHHRPALSTLLAPYCPCPVVVSDFLAAPALGAVRLARERIG